MNLQSTKKILAAFTPAYMPAKMIEVLDARFELVFCTSLEQAQSLIHDHFDLVACDTHFDDCRMFDLLRICKANPVVRAVPFVCLRLVEGDLDETLYQSVDIASKALGAVEFVDLFRLKRKCGAEEAYRQLRVIIERLASASSEDGESG